MGKGDSMSDAKKDEGTRLYEQNWYAVAMSSEVAAGKAIGADYLDGRVVVWRGEDGSPHVMSAWCAHLGADLSVGDVVGREIRCAFHHWHYGADGVCSKIPSGDAIPPKARVHGTPNRRALGAPSGPSTAPSRSTLRRSFPISSKRELRYRVVPVTEFPLRALGRAHQLRRLPAPTSAARPHDPVRSQRRADGGSRPRIRGSVRVTEFGSFDQKIRVFGTNTICLRGTMGAQRMLTMYSGTPRPNGYTRGWVVSAAPRPREETADAVELCEQQVAMTEAFFVGLIEQDTPVMSNIRFREGVLVPADRALARFLNMSRLPESERPRGVVAAETRPRRPESNDGKRVPAPVSAPAASGGLANLERHGPEADGSGSRPAGSHPRGRTSSG